MLTVLDKCPTCGAARAREAKPEKALVAWSQSGNALITEYTKDGLLEKIISETSDWAHEIFDLSDVPVPSEKLLIWEGTSIMTEEECIALTGKFRNLTPKEWGLLKDGLLLFNAEK